MVDYIVDEHNIDVDPGCIKRVKVAFLSYVHLILVFFLIEKSPL